MSRRSQVGFVYVFQIGERGPVKIGFSANPMKRFAQLDAATPWPLRVLGTVAGTVENEAFAHHKLCGYRMHGEWFKPAPRVLAFCREVLSPSWEWPSAAASDTRDRSRADTPIAAEMQSIVKAAAEPVAPGETVSRQIERAAERLGFKPGDWRVRAAWYGEAAGWSATVVDDFRVRASYAGVAIRELRRSAHEDPVGKV